MSAMRYALCAELAYQATQHATLISEAGSQRFGLLLAHKPEL
jgi:hypothetical protein